ncbi:MAG: hypothetical protein ABI175_05180 [Polyangiales bacterium]
MHDTFSVTWRDTLVLFAVSMVASSAIGTHGLAYWDAGDYVRQAVRSQPSGLLLGRPLFLFVSRLVASVPLRAGWGAASIEPTLRWFWAAISACAPPLLASLVARLRFGRAAALAAGVALAIAPSFAHTAHQVLTDGPALAISLAALVIGLPRSEEARASLPAYRAFLAGAVVAAAIATRETSAVQLLALLAILSRKRWNVLAAIVACLSGVALVVVVAKRNETMLGWILAMARSSNKHPVTLRDFGLSAGWLLALGPVPVILGVLELVSFARRRWGTGGARDTLSNPAFAGTRAVVVPSAVATVLLVLYPDGSFSPRYLLATGPIAFFVLAAPRLSDLLSDARSSRKLTRLLVACALVAPLAVAPFTTRHAEAIAERAAALPARLAQIPDGTLVVPGHTCAAVGAWLAVEDAAHAGHTGPGLPDERIELLCPGWSWPGEARELELRLDRARCRGRALAIDLADEAWVGTRELEAKEQVRGYARTHPGPTVAGFTMIPALAFDDPTCR